MNCFLPYPVCVYNYAYKNTLLPLAVIFSSVANSNPYRHSAIPQDADTWTLADI